MLLQLKLILNDLNLDHAIIIVHGFDDLSCNDHKMVMVYKVSSCLNGGDGVFNCAKSC